MFDVQSLTTRYAMSSGVDSSGRVSKKIYDIICNWTSLITQKLLIVAWQITDWWIMLNLNIV